MSSPAADRESSPAPTANEGETVAEAVEGVGVAAQEGVMEAGAVAAIEEPDEVEPEEVEEAVEPEMGTATGEEPDEEADDLDEDPDEDVREEAGGASDEEAVMEPLAVLNPGDVQEEENELEETEEEEEPSEVDDESGKVVGQEEQEDTKKGVEAGVIVVDGAKGLVHESASDGVNDKIEGEHVKCGDKNKDEVADILSNVDDADGSRNGYMQNSELAGGFELLVHELPMNCVEEDIAIIFSGWEIKSVRIIRNSSTEKSKDIAFVCFASMEAAEKALTEFKKGIEVKGMKVRVSACQDNNTLFLGNICKSWTKDQVLSALNNIGIQEYKLSLPSSYKGKNRGFAFLEFESHYYARAAFQRLIKSDAIFGIDRSVTVSFHRNPTKPSDDLIEAKRVYLEHVPLSWNEDNIKQCCEEYGKILNIDLFQLSKNMKSETFSFIEFSSINSALACVEGINNAKIFDGSFKLSACLARPKNGTTLEGATTSNKENDHMEKVCVDKNLLQKLPKGNKGRLISRAKEVAAKQNAPNKLLKDNERKISLQDAAEVQQSSKPSEGERKLGRNKNAFVNQRPSKKARNKCYVDGSNLTDHGAAVLQRSNPSKGKRKPDKDVNTYINKRPLKRAHDNRNVKQLSRTKGAGQPGLKYSRAHHSLGESSSSKAYASDLEPHAGYIPPANQVHSTQAYDQRRTGRYDIHPIDVHPYARETAPSRSTYADHTSHASYTDHTSHARYQTEYEYIYPHSATSGSYYPGWGRIITRRGDY